MELVIKKLKELGIRVTACGTSGFLGTRIVETERWDVEYPDGQKLFGISTDMLELIAS